MTVSKILTFTVMTLAFPGVISTSLAADLPITISVTHTNGASLQAYNVAPLLVTTPDDINKSIQGTEQSECMPYGRQSSATANVNFSDTADGDRKLHLVMGTKVYAQGGHFRTWYYKNPPVCIGFSGNDETGSAQASSKATVKIQFSPDFAQPAAYLLTLNQKSDGVLPNVRLTDGSGKPVPSAFEPGKPFILHGAPGDVFYLELDQEVSASDRGGCCNDSKSSASVFDISLEPAPVLSADGLIGFIKGGEQTTGYANVGALVLNGDIHCTATLIGTRTVLTAAHCLQPFEDDRSDMVFVLGNNYQIPAFKPAGLTGFDYPKGEGGFKFNPKTLEDDIGVAYLSDPLPAKVAPLFADNPTWETIIKNQTSIIFVGFGYNVVDGNKTAPGIKREGSWVISTLENRRVGFSVDGKNTCKGDSGGPAFYEEPNSYILAGITSGGDKACTYGYETRVDAYLDWLKPRIR